MKIAIASDDRGGCFGVTYIIKAELLQVRLSINITDNEKLRTKS